MTNLRENKKRIENFQACVKRIIVLQRHDPIHLVESNLIVDRGEGREGRDDNISRRA